MQSKRTKDLTQLDIYKKAIEVFTLSRRVVSYITYDKDVLALRRSKNDIDILSSAIVTNALSLVPKIVEIEHEKDFYIKIKATKSLLETINELNENCNHLLLMQISGKDYITLLKEEVKKLQLLHKDYVNSIIEA